MLSLFSVEKYISLSLSLLVWLLHMLVCASQLMWWQIVNVCVSIWLVNIIYLRVAGVRQNVSFMYVYSFYILLINVFLPEYIGIQFLSDMVW